VVKDFNILMPLVIKRVKPEKRPYQPPI